MNLYPNCLAKLNHKVLLALTSITTAAAWKERNRQNSKWMLDSNTPPGLMAIGLQPYYQRSPFQQLPRSTMLH